MRSSLTRVSFLVLLSASGCGGSPGAKGDAGRARPDGGGDGGALGKSCTQSSQCGGSPTDVCEPIDQCGNGFCSETCDAGSCPAPGRCVAIPWVDPTTVTTGALRLCLLPCDAGQTCPGATFCDPTYKACLSGALLEAVGDIGARVPGGGACLTPVASPTAPPRLLGTNVLASDPASAGANEPAAAIAPDGTLYVAYNDDTSGIGVAVSHDGGATWAFAAPSDPGAIGDPSLALDTTVTPARVYFSYIVFFSGFSCPPGDIYPAESAIHIAWSDDEGKSWSSGVAVSDPAYTSAKYLTDKPWTVVDAAGIIHTSYSVFDATGVAPTRVFAATSHDRGATFTSVEFAPAGGQNLVQDAVDAAGNLYLSWFGGDSLGEGILFARSTDGGATFSAPRRVSPDNSLVYDPPVVSVTPDGGRLFVTYTHGDSGLASDIELATSADGGSTFSAPLRVNDDVTCASHIKPWNAVDTHGNVYVAWYDERYADARVMARLGTVTASAGGLSVSFGPVAQITDMAFPYTTNRSQLFLGDYLAFSVSETTAGPRALAAWGDLRRAVQQAMMGVPGPKAASIFAAAGAVP